MDLSADRQAGNVAFHEKGRDTGKPLGGIGPGEDHEDVGHRGVRNEGLISVEDEAASLSLCSGAEAKGVRSGSGLGHRLHPDDRPVAQAGEKAALLILPPELQQRNLAAPHLGVKREEQAVVPTRIAKRLQGDHNRQRVQTGPPIVLGNG